MRALIMDLALLAAAVHTGHYCLLWLCLFTGGYSGSPRSDANKN
jgi:hypothetical protein